LKNKEELFWATVGWDGIDEETEGEYTFIRYNIDHLIVDISYYLDKWKTREPYLVCASHELEGKAKDITESVRLFMEKINN